MSSLRNVFASQYPSLLMSPPLNTLPSQFSSPSMSFSLNVLPFQTLISLFLNIFLSLLLSFFSNLNVFFSHCWICSHLNVFPSVRSLFLISFPLNLPPSQHLSLLVFVSLGVCLSQCPSLINVFFSQILFLSVFVPLSDCPSQCLFYFLLLSDLII